MKKGLNTVVGNTDSKTVAQHGRHCSSAPRQPTGDPSMHSQARLFLSGVMLLLVLLLGVTPARAGRVHLAWDAPDASTLPAGYLLSYWQEPSGVPQSVPVGLQTIYTLTGLADGATYSFAVTAYDAEGNESEDSNMVTITIPAGPALLSPPPAALLPG